MSPIPVLQRILLAVMVGAALVQILVLILR